MGNPEDKRKLRPKLWHKDEIHFFLNLFEVALRHEGLTAFEDCEEQLWVTISDTLKVAHGVDASASQCHSKWNSLYKTYIAYPTRECSFFAKIKKIVEISLENNVPSTLEQAEPAPKKMKVEIEPLDSELLFNETEHFEQQPNEPKVNQTQDVEVLEDDPTVGDNLNDLLRKLCAKIDTLTELQRRQELRIDEVAQMQKTNHDHLLEIKNLLNLH
ncbi:uncharacterized protein LOC131207840 [Anopheles bellator]|uniref:uncharacterized protein LOC131207840 n=1 Tax=Anopheles bellator TaxID=139047 RepID=UPI002647A358|nr:uncharacterized protein LOC131207840 [Anopheles bellator]